MIKTKIYEISLYLRWIFKLIDIFRNHFTSLNKDHVKILMYHSIGSNLNLELDVSKLLFQKQLDFLQQQGRIISIEESLNQINSHDKKKENLFVLTFDDGYSNFYFNVFPELINRSIPATLFPALEFIDNPTSKPIQEEIKNKSWELIKPLSKEQIRELSDSKLITIGSHGYHHFNYAKSSISKIKKDIKKAEDWFKLNLGKKPNIFCYPMGFSNHPSENFIKDKFKLALKASYIKKATGKYKKESYPRLGVLKSDGLFWFKLRIKGYLYREHEIIRFFIRFLKLGQ